MDGLHRAFLERQVTLFAPRNEAMLANKGRRTENLILNHMTNIALRTSQLPEKLTSLVTGYGFVVVGSAQQISTKFCRNPPLWITQDRTGLYVNQAKITRENIQARSTRGDEQVSECLINAGVFCREQQFFNS